MVSNQKYDGAFARDTRKTNFFEEETSGRKRELPVKVLEAVQTMLFYLNHTCATPDLVVAGALSRALKREDSATETFWLGATLFFSGF